jgi:K+-sensing histidine kinase KdpD
LPFSPSRYVRLQDVLWIALFAALIFSSQTRSAPEVTMLVALAIAQVLESKLPALASTRGRIFWILLNLALLYLLIGFTGSVNSPYWLLLTLPVLSGAAALGVMGTLVVSVLAAGFYLSFFLLIDWRRFEIFPEDISATVVKMVFLLMAGLLANALAEDLRVQTQNSRRAAEQLSAANDQLQQAEDAVRRSDRLAALGQLSAGLAHEQRKTQGTNRG